MTVFLLPEGGPAHQSGLCQGDVVLQLNGLPVETWKCIDLAHAIRSPSLLRLVHLFCLGLNGNLGVDETVTYVVLCVAEVAHHELCWWCGDVYLSSGQRVRLCSTHNHTTE